MTISTQVSLRVLLDEIRHRSHATAGFTIALTGATAAALGQSCVGISRPPGPDNPAHARLGEIVNSLADWADQDATALARMIVLRDQGKEHEGWEVLVSAPVAIADLACEGAELLQQFRPQVVEHVRDDMELGLHLLSVTARAALMLVESNLRQWRAPGLHAKFGPEIERLTRRIDALQPVKHVAWV